MIGTIPVYTHDEEGLQGVGVDPGFASNRQIYLYYAPPLSTPAGDAPATGSNWSAWQGVNRLSRFTLNADFSLNTGRRVILRLSNKGRWHRLEGHRGEAVYSNQPVSAKDF